VHELLGELRAAARDLAGKESWELADHVTATMDESIMGLRHTRRR